MTSQNTSYPCPRCGKERIVSKQWQEPAESSISGQPTFHTLMICPDQVCQAKLSQKLDAEKEKRTALRQAKEQRYTDSQQRGGKQPPVAADSEPQAS